MYKGSNVNNLILNVLPDNRPITSLQIVEDYEKCPKEFVPVHRTYDQDADADLWRETAILFGRRTNRYLCQSKSQGLPHYVIETLKVISEKEQPPAGYSLLSRTADTDQKAWRKRQIAYKLAKRGTISQAVTDIILCSKFRSAPAGFELAGEINGITVCYKLGVCAHRTPPMVPKLGAVAPVDTTSAIENAMHYMNVTNKPFYPLPKTPTANGADLRPTDDYENIQADYRLPTPTRPPPSIPQRNSLTPLAAAATGPPTVQHHTLGAYSDIDGVPFTLNPRLLKPTTAEKEITAAMFDSPSACDSSFVYNFQLERQVLCTLKTSTSKNPFFQRK